jgi:PKD repeat protein
MTTSHTYADPGNYTATLKVTDDDGATGMDSLLITVTGVVANKAPIAVAKANQTSGYAPLSVGFDGSSSTDSDGTIVDYGWNFGDGGTGVGSKVAHTYATPGTYTAVLTVTDDDGATNTSSITITVSVAVPTINAPSNLVAKSSSGNVLLKWTDNSNNEAGFVIERATKVKGVISPFVVVATVGAGVVSYSDPASPSTYIYRVYAYNAEITSAYSNLATVRVK